MSGRPLKELSWSEQAHVHRAESAKRRFTSYFHLKRSEGVTMRCVWLCAGAIIVKDDPATLPEELRGIRDLVLMMQHINMQKGACIAEPRCAGGVV